MEPGFYPDCRTEVYDNEMGEDAIIIIAVGGAAVALIGLIVGLVVRRERKRRDRLAAVAGQMGARFEPRPDSQFVRELRDVFWVFRTFRARFVTNLIDRPSAGMSSRFFDYAYWRLGSRSPTMWSVLLVSSPLLSLPPFTMGNNGGALRIRDGFFGEPVKFPVEEFAAQHQVHGDERDAIENAFSEELQRFLAGHSEYCMEGRGDEFVLYVPDKRAAPDAVRRMIDDGGVIARAFGGDS